MDGVEMTRYKVTGTQPVLDQQPGHIFEADIPSELEMCIRDSV